MVGLGWSKNELDPKKEEGKVRIHRMYVTGYMYTCSCKETADVDDCRARANELETQPHAAYA